MCLSRWVLGPLYLLVHHVVRLVSAGTESTFCFNDSWEFHITTQFQDLELWKKQTLITIMRTGNTEEARSSERLLVSTSKTFLLLDTAKTSQSSPRWSCLSYTKTAGRVCRFLMVVCGLGHCLLVAVLLLCDHMQSKEQSWILMPRNGQKSKQASRCSRLQQFWIVM